MTKPQVQEKVPRGLKKKILHESWGSFSNSKVAPKSANDVGIKMYCGYFIHIGYAPGEI